MGSSHLGLCNRPRSTRWLLFVTVSFRYAGSSGVARRSPIEPWPKTPSLGSPTRSARLVDDHEPTAAVLLGRPAPTCGSRHRASLSPSRSFDAGYLRYLTWRKRKFTSRQPEITPDSATVRDCWVAQICSESGHPPPGRPASGAAAAMLRPIQRPSGSKVWVWRALRASRELVRPVACRSAERPDRRPGSGAGHELRLEVSRIQRQQRRRSDLGENAARAGLSVCPGIDHLSIPTPEDLMRVLG